MPPDRRSARRLAALALILAAPAAPLPPTCRNCCAAPTRRPTRAGKDFMSAARPADLSASANFGNATQPLVALHACATHARRQFVSRIGQCRKSSTQQYASYGGFIGYNWQWDDVVLGFELNYITCRGGFGAEIARHDPGSTTANIRTMSRSVRRHNASIKLDRSMTSYCARARRLYLSTIHALRLLALRSVVRRLDTLQSCCRQPKRQTIDCTPPALSSARFATRQRDAKDNTACSATALQQASALDMRITPNLFVRGEWEFDRILRMSATCADSPIGSRRASG